VRGAVAAAMERDERAVRALEREVADREARAAARERALVAREDKARAQACLVACLFGRMGETRRGPCKLVTHVLCMASL
jgi:hypothetical protein